MCEALCAYMLIAQAFILCILLWGTYEYIRLRRQMVISYKEATNKLQSYLQPMECDEIIDQLLEQQHTPVAGVAVAGATAETVVAPGGASHVDTSCVATHNRPEDKRERLAALVAGGKASQYLGKALTADQVDSMDDNDIEKLYARYEARLGAAMTKTLGQAVLQLYSCVASMFLPIPLENQPKLVADLETDPFVGHALSSATCGLYHRYGMYLAPLTAALTTAKYCQFRATPPHNIDTEDVGDCDSTSGESNQQ